MIRIWVTRCSGCPLQTREDDTTEDKFCGHPQCPEDHKTDLLGSLPERFNFPNWCPLQNDSVRVEVMVPSQLKVRRPPRSGAFKYTKPYHSDKRIKGYSPKRTRTFPQYRRA